MKPTFTPDFIGVGGEKTASSWLFQCLDEHPEICGSHPKETFFFNKTKLIGNEMPSESLYEREGIEAYARYFNHCGDERLKGEYTATYMHDKAVAPILAHHFPQTKIIISLRNPIDRTFSMYRGLPVERRPRTFEEAIKYEPEFLRRSMYSEYVKEYMDRYPRERIFITLYDDTERDPKRVLRQLYEFLDVDSSFVPPSANRRVRSSYNKRRKQYHHRLRRMPAGRMISAVLSKTGALSLAAVIGEQRANRLSTSTRRYLYDIFKRDITRLEQIIERDLSSWR